MAEVSTASTVVDHEFENQVTMLHATNSPKLPGIFLGKRQNYVERKLQARKLLKKTQEQSNPQMSLIDKHESQHVFHHKSEPELSNKL